MIAVLAYGSLMHPDEHYDHRIRDWPLVPVRVLGFRRSFSQVPTWRSGSPAERGVLTIRPSAADWFNAIMICGWDPRALKLLDHRERGYTRRTLPESALDPYLEQNPLEAVREVNVYVGREEKRNDALQPNAEYLELCAEAASRWGEEFLEDFLSTTYVGGTTLHESSR
jgi:cation transport regulator ChaC